MPGVATCTGPLNNGRLDRSAVDALAGNRFLKLTSKHAPTGYVNRPLALLTGNPMKVISLKCPSCGAHIDPPTDADSFFCRYCGSHLEAVAEHGKKELREVVANVAYLVRASERSANTLDKLNEMVGDIRTSVQPKVQPTPEPLPAKSSTVGGWISAIFFWLSALVVTVWLGYWYGFEWMVIVGSLSFLGVSRMVKRPSEHLSAMEKIWVVLFFAALVAKCT